VKHYLQNYFDGPGRILDPFAGVGASLYAANELGWDSVGIEMLPVGAFVMEIRNKLTKVDTEKLKEKIKDIDNVIKNGDSGENLIKHINITLGAFPKENERKLNTFLRYTNSLNDPVITDILRFAAFCILEEISYTRKDGQYLRWDYRTEDRTIKSKFNKGRIFDFDEAIKRKLEEIIQDLNGGMQKTLFKNDFENRNKGKKPIILQGSCFEIMPKQKENRYECIFTSPPYCNRYDYTRTYALELVYLGYNEEQVKKLRQDLLSATVENKEKIDWIEEVYSDNGHKTAFNEIIAAYQSCDAMTEVNSVLKRLLAEKRLNNSNIPRMIKNYFLEMCFTIYEMARVLKSGGYIVMVNDNVRYGGEEIPVDLILSSFAESFGLKIENIFKLPTNKGNSSQQMGNYGRSELRKCVYIWRKH
jgi:DNA modification methylase